MDGIAAGTKRGGNQRILVQIAFGGWRGSDADRMVGQLYVQAFFIGGRIDGDRFNIHFAARADNADGNFSAVCNQHFPYHA